MSDNVRLNAQMYKRRDVWRQSHTEDYNSGRSRDSNQYYPINTTEDWPIANRAVNGCTDSE